MDETTKVLITREKYKYDEYGIKIRNPKPTKIIWESPDKVEMKDEDGDVHTYSIIKILDGLTVLADKLKQEGA